MLPKATGESVGDEKSVDRPIEPEQRVCKGCLRRFTPRKPWHALCARCWRTERSLSDWGRTRQNTRVRANLRGNPYADKRCD